ncbi:TonB-dependent hemoglobin/transferrin/lactoferrin family receptor [Bordetella trematum]|uniref:TonB-dependent hemoglobin/transferrin/lactoferrin family receptor n=1 Tax=Bordetella trematum TaxID=123899 RepID=UPI003D0FE15E
MRKRHSPPRLLLPALIASAAACGPATADPIWQLPAIPVQGNSPDEGPSSAQYDAEELSRNNVFDSRDLVRYEPGIAVNEGNRGNSNGYAMRGVDGARVAVTVDGMPQADPLIPGIYASYGFLNGNRNGVELEHVKSVTLHKGADSVQSGSGGIGGSVQFVTKDIDDFVSPGHTFGAYGKVGYASRNREKLAVTGLGARFGTGSSVFLQYTRRDGRETRHYGAGQDILGDQRGIPDPVRQRSEALLGKLDVCIRVGHCVQLTYEQLRKERLTRALSRASWDIRNIHDRSPYDRQALVYRAMLQDGLLQRFETGLYLQQQSQRTITDRYHARRQSLDRRYDRSSRQDDIQWRSTFESRPLTGALGIHALSFEASLGRRRSSDHNVDAFFEQRGTRVLAYRLMNPVSVSSLSLKASDRFAFGEHLDGSVGLRLDRYTHSRQATTLREPRHVDVDGRKRFSALSSFARLGYRLPAGLKLSYGVSQGFRAPSAKNLYFYFETFGNFYEPNPDLKPERALNQDLTLSGQWPGASVAFTVFRTRYQDFIEERYSKRLIKNPQWGSAGCAKRRCREFLSESVYSPHNVDQAWVQGLELRATLDAHKLLGLAVGLGAELRVTRVRGGTSTGDGLRALQPDEAQLRVFYTAAQAKWGATLTLTQRWAKRAADTRRTEYDYDGPSSSEAEFLSNAVHLVDLSAFWRLSDAITLNAGVYNLLNRRYFEWNTLRNLEVDPKGLNRYSAPGRHFALNLVARF